MTKSYPITTLESLLKNLIFDLAALILENASYLSNAIEYVLILSAKRKTE